MDRATSTGFLSLSVPIRARFLETAHILWVVNGSYPWARTAYLFNLPLDVLSLSCSQLQLAVYCKGLKTFLIGTPGIRLKSLWTVWNQKFIWDVFKSSHLSSEGRVRGRRLFGGGLIWLVHLCVYVRMFLCVYACMLCLVLCMCLSLSVNTCFLMHHKLFSICIELISSCQLWKEPRFPEAHYSFF